MIGDPIDPEVLRAINDCVPFSIVCVDCDTGMEIDSLEGALLRNWSGIIYDPDGLSWNFLGHCPDCRAAEEARDLTLMRKESPDAGS